MVHRFVDDSAARPVIEPVLQLSERFGGAFRYRPSASDIAHPVPPRKGGGRAGSRVQANGFGVAVELQTLQGSKPAVFREIQQAVCQVFPHIKDIGFRSDWQGVSLSFGTDRSEDRIPAQQESDGVLLATFLFWRLYTSSTALKVCLEEPENGLHPFLLADRFRLLKKFASAGNAGPPVQLLVATHSPEFLRQVKAHPHALWREIRLVEFKPEIGTSVRRLSNYNQATHLIDEYLAEMHHRWEPVIQNWAS